MNQYLILHKVRGEAKFDCAEQMDVNGETFWITNAGHRAYPVQSWRIDGSDGLLESLPIAEVPADWPEHFAVSDKPLAKKGQGLNIMDFIKIPEPKVRLIRRRI